MLQLLVTENSNHPQLSCYSSWQTLWQPSYILENTPYPDLLQPLEVPDQAWTHISMDFIKGLPESEGKNVILVVIDRFSKYTHYIALAHPYTAPSVAKIFLDNIVKLHGKPLSIVTDRDLIFTNLFWKELFKLMGIDLVSPLHTIPKVMVKRRD